MVNTRGKVVARPTVAESTSEEEFWKDDAPDEMDHWDGVGKILCGTVGGNDSNETPRANKKTGRLETTVRRSPRKRMLMEKSVGSNDIQEAQVPLSRAHAIPTPQHSGNSSSSTSSPRKAPGTARYELDGYDTDADEVEHILGIDTDGDGSAPPSRPPSFQFSNPSVSRETSFTSAASDSISGPTTPNTRRKRTYDYPDSFDVPPSPVSPAKVQKRASQTETSSYAPGASKPIAFPRPRPHAVARTRTPSPNKSSSSQTTTDSSPSRRGRWLGIIEETLASDKAKATNTTTARGPDRTEVPTYTTVLSSSPTVTPQGPFSATKGSVSSSSFLGTRADQQRPQHVTTSSCVSVIAHCREVQRIMDYKRTSWGVQYELARGVCAGRWQWNDVTAEKLELLRGPNKEKAHCVEQVMLKMNVPRSAQLASLPLWAELDREDKAIEEGVGRGLGLHGEWEGDPNWYGGKIRQIASVVETKDGFELHLKAMMKRKSNRFARFLGSRRMIQVKLPDDKIMRKKGEDVRKFMLSKFVLCGRIFVSFAAKDGKVFLMETNEDYERDGNSAVDRGRMSLEDFVRWHNPMETNRGQPVTKWVTRFELGLSDTVPALEFQGEGIDMLFIDDKVAPHDGKKAPAEKILTDGCGFMNWAALASIARALKYNRFPTAVQGRIAGSKGVWMLHPRDRSPDATPKIWIRPSQQKIKHKTLHAAHRIFELVAPPRVSAPSRLSRHTIMVLSHNCVRDEDIIALMAAGVDAEVRALSSFDDPHLLRAAVAEVGRILPARLQRLASGSGRVLGLGRGWGQDEEDEEGDLEHGGPLSVVDRNEHSGDPVKVHERAYEMLAAGFRPLENDILFRSLRDIVGYRIAELIREYHMTVPKSAEAFIVPDPYGVLKPGQIHFKASEDLKDPLDGPSPNLITGNVLIYRNPARLPADIQKVTAIAHPILSDYTDVIVLPVTGHRSLASLLAGGDYDGDTCVCVYDELIVETFRGSLVTDIPEDFLQKNFQSQDNISQVGDVLTQKMGPTGTRESSLQQALLAGMISPNYGLYSIFHENAAYVYGLADKRTIHNAWMFNTVLDSKKTGHVVKASVLAEDTGLYGHEQPHCMNLASSEEVDTECYGRKQHCPTRTASLPPFILDELLKAGKKLEAEQLGDFEKKSQQPQYNTRDADLLKPWEQAITRANTLKQKGHADLWQDLEMIEQHVADHIKRWHQAIKVPAKRDSKSKSPQKSPTTRQQGFNILSKTFTEELSDLVFYDRKSICALKASYAYKENPRFAFSVAFYELCKMKAESVGIAAYTQELVDMMAMPSSARRILMQKASGL
ncbi:hypothetical protein DAEQUDRAFT_721969 [Daedalea quercina L-15889]|uniref:RNA-dependent RNA polymerase n=1 Tax=Daedalea quercina L-15889 TaxID=1314783 RepID=A0A165TFU5_9APHY|nr:hypothetical protein DAEQUDRAFT_721969 [Daedalea quercina L-15889]